MPKHLSLIWRLAIPFSLAVLAGCAEVKVDDNTDTDTGSDTGSDTDTDIDTDTDSDSDTDTDTDSDTDTDTDSDAGPEVPIPCTAETAAELCGSVELCVDGFCCDGPCDGTCEACNLSDLEGDCSFLDAGVDPDEECETEVPETCGSTGLCDGYGACELYGSETACGTSACPSYYCDSNVYWHNPESCVNTCDGAGACGACTCTPIDGTTCAAGAANECCVASCVNATGCITSAGSCADICTAGVLTLERACDGCGANLADGTCGGGTSYGCDSANSCEQRACGGVDYTCTNSGGTWEWRESTACDDADSCTYDDVCSGGVCAGTSITCTSTDCMIRTCSGTSACTETPLSDTTTCGTSACPVDYCLSTVFYNYPGTCTRTCDGAGVCEDCSCSAAVTTCGVGPANQCCTAGCDAATGGCLTTSVTCPESCTANQITIGQTCVGCGPADGEGICSGGGSYACSSATHTLCQTLTCGGTTYRCTNNGGTWAWRTSVVCDDSNQCTYNDACNSGSCIGTTITCTSTACMNSTCNGTSACTETPKPSSTVCGTTPCPADYCTVLDFYNYPATCTRTCSGTDDTCNSCSCSAAMTTCGVGVTNECCTASCSETLGCQTAPGLCGAGGDTCGENLLDVNQTCQGCGAAGAAGTCVAGGSYTCDDVTHSECETRSCGGEQYYCLEDVVDGWGWTTEPACDDGALCTYNDACSGGTCLGTTITCTSTACMTKTCNGTSTCTQTPKSSSTTCGTTACPADYCLSSVYYNYPGTCTRYCSGAGDVCNSCSCTAPPTTCGVGPANQCCTAGCDDVAGCNTTAGTCADVCTATTVTTGRNCTGCGDNLADGTCGAGTSTTCSAATSCQTRTCGGTTYRCTNTGGAWEWRTSTACDDGNLCTYGDVCSGGVCEGISVSCTSTSCMTKTCNGTSTCTQTPKSSSTTCGTTSCPADYCTGLDYYNYPATCTRYCSGTGDVCNACSCSAVMTTCGVGVGDQCCTASCSETLGCQTAPGSCGTGGDTCGENLLEVNQNCEGCGAGGAAGTCLAGGSYTCDELTNSECEAQTCGGVQYYCMDDPVFGWGWTADPACDDGNPCTYNDACSAGTCQGTAITCTDTACMTKTCNGTSLCTNTPKASSTTCGTTACPADYCLSNVFYNYPGTCTRYCSGTGDVCNSCSCTAPPTTCGVGAANECCAASCNASTGGCLTTNDTCPETCTANQLTIGQTCVGCGPAGAEGMCSGGTVYTCSAASHDLCQTMSCGGTTYRCTNSGGTWAWRTSVACDDSNPCTFSDACSGSSCTGTTVTCTSTTCMNSACNGTSTCTNTPKPSSTTCGTTSCPADYCTGVVYYNYPATCTRYCSGTGDVCNACSCTAPPTTCVVGSGNVCCTATCSETLGCQTTPGLCGAGGDTCTENLLEVNQTCQGCGASGAAGTCVAGGSYVCDDLTNSECETRSCGGTQYYCLEDPVFGWGWTSDPVCDDGAPCTYNDACSAGECKGTAVTCTSTSCMTKTCNGTSTCTETPKSSSTTCGATACPADYCSSLDYYDYPASCQRYCSGTGDVCNSCSCSAGMTTCGVGAGNQCCTAACNASTGCLTADGACADSCTNYQLTTGQSCAGCGAGGAAGTCGGGTVSTCNASTHALCQTRSCGGTTYYCTNAGGNWEWRTAVACSDGNACTYGDLCFGGSCNGTSITCTDTACMTKTCNGTSTCTETPKSSGTTCGTTACDADYCLSNVYYNYPGTCTRYCSGTGDVCNSCSCTPTTAACTAGGCCNAACTPASGCSTTTGTCGGGESCGANTITLASTCSGCGAAGATGTCGGGGTYTCNSTTHTACQTVTCGGLTYNCTLVGGIWQWRTSTACDDTNACTYNDLCGGGVCQGTAITCTSTSCMTKTCNGTSTCTETPKSSSTTCGSTTCAADYCSASVFYDYPASCTRYCTGSGDVCNSCTCSAGTTTCAAGGGNECCTVTCTGGAGCGTAAGSCTDSCGSNLLTTGRACSGCGLNLANGTCGGGTASTCDASIHTLCQTLACGGTSYRCTNAGGTWAWRTAADCDDGNAGTINDTCQSDGTCVGTTTGVGDCCTAHSWAGCSESTISSCVCAIDSYCCDTSWDSLCVSEVESGGCGVCNCTACAWSSNLESSNGGFTASGTTTFAWGAPTSGPLAAHSGSNVWATNLTGYYNNYENGYITSPVINLSAYSGSSISINWWQWFTVESGYDYISVEASSNGGSTWAVVYGPTSTSAAAWGRQTVVVSSSYAVSNFVFRLHFTSDVSITYDGWYVDDFCVAPASAGTGSNESFDAGNGGYTVSGSTTTWAWGAPTSGPYAAHSGSYLWATNLSGTYLNYEDGYITSPNIDLSGLAADPSIPLSWWSWYAGETCCDYASVDVSNNGGSSWTTVWGPNYGSTTGSWVNQSVSLGSSYAVSNFRVRFFFHSDVSIVYDGWYVDDVIVGTPGSTMPACEP